MPEREKCLKMGQAYKEQVKRKRIVGEMKTIFVANLQ